MLTFLPLLLCYVISEYKLLESCESFVNQFLTVVNMILAQYSLSVLSLSDVSKMEEIIIISQGIQLGLTSQTPET